MEFGRKYSNSRVTMKEHQKRLRFSPIHFIPSVPNSSSSVLHSISLKRISFNLKRFFLSPSFFRLYSPFIYCFFFYFLKHFFYTLHLIISLFVDWSCAWLSAQHLLSSSSSFTSSSSSFNSSSSSSSSSSFSSFLGRRSIDRRYWDWNQVENWFCRYRRMHHIKGEELFISHWRKYNFWFFSD